MQSAIPYVQPTFSSDGENILEIKAARHPCIEVQPFVSYIPNDVRADGKISLKYVLKL